jgi:hypothetical protein
MKYSVKTLRAAGLEARWTRSRHGAPIIVARKSGSSTWWHVGQDMWKRMIQIGVIPAFERHTLLGDIFSVPV